MSSHNIKEDDNNNISMRRSRKSSRHQENKLDQSTQSIKSHKSLQMQSEQGTEKRRSGSGTRIKNVEETHITQIESEEQKTGFQAFLHKLRLLDAFKVSIYPRKFKNQSFFGSIGGFCCTILCIGYIVVAFLIFFNAINKPINMDWYYARPYNIGIQFQETKEQSLYYSFENNPEFTLDGGDAQLYLKIDNVIEQTRPVDGSGNSINFSDVLDPSGCTNTDGWCDYSQYSKNKITVDEMNNKDYEMYIDVQIWESIDILKDKLIEGGQEGSLKQEAQVKVFQNSLDDNVGFVSENSGQQNLIPIFNNDDMKFAYQNGQIMLISLMSNNDWYDDQTYSVGFSVELAYKKHFYDRFSNKNLNETNFQTGVQKIYDQDKIWVKLGFGQNFREQYPNTDIPPYKANPMHFENQRVVSFGTKQYFLDGSRIPWTLSDESQIEQTIHVEEFNSLKFENQRQFLRQYGNQPEWAKSGQFNLDVSKATLAQYWVYWTGEKENVYVKFPSTDYYVLNIMTLLIFSVPIFSCLGLTMNKCCLHRELNSLYKGNKDYLKLDPLELSQDFIYTNYKDENGELIAHADLANGIVAAGTNGGIMLSQNNMNQNPSQRSIQSKRTNKSKNTRKISSQNGDEQKDINNQSINEHVE